MKFSVIVPIYKVEEYLGECVESVLKQSYEDFELILVDDGSPDGCGALCDSYAEADERVKVIHKENGGLVSARQAGIEAATGEYIVNVDGDDYIDGDMLKNSFDIINAHSPDVIYFSMMNFNSKSRWVSGEYVAEGFYDKRAITERIYPKVLMNENMEHLNYLITVKVAKREILKPIQLSVDTRINLGEDLACSVPLITAADSLYVSGLPMYYYRHRDTSISKNFNIAWFEQLDLCMKRIDELCSAEIDNLEEQLSRYAMFLCFGMLGVLSESGAHKRIGQYKEKIQGESFKNRISNAKFSKITPKTRITYGLIRGGHIRLAYIFLGLCRILKRG